MTTAIPLKANYTGAAATSLAEFQSTDIVSVPCPLAGTDTTDATSSTAAAVKTAGGLAVAKKINIGTDATVGGNLTFTGAGNRITGDYSNATAANRVLFQSSTTDGQTIIEANPNGTSTTTQFIATNSSDTLNASRVRLFITSSVAVLDSGIVGTGTQLPLSFRIGNTEKLAIATSGNVTAIDSFTAKSATSIPAGGIAGAGLMVSSTANFGVFFGSGAPTLSAAKGSLYLRSDGSSTSTRMYVNTDGSTTWTAVTTAS